MLRSILKTINKSTFPIALLLFGISVMLLISSPTSSDVPVNFILMIANFAVMFNRMKVIL